MVEEQLSKDDFVLTLKWNAMDLTIEQHVGIFRCDGAREQIYFSVCNTHYCIFLGIDRKAHSSSGVLHVTANGRTGTVCDDGFGTNEGIAICKQLGFYYLRQYNSNDFAGESFIGNILADRFTCPRQGSTYRTVQDFPENGLTGPAVHGNLVKEIKLSIRNAVSNFQVDIQSQNAFTKKIFG